MNTFIRYFATIIATFLVMSCNESTVQSPNASSDTERSSIESASSWNGASSETPLSSTLSLSSAIVEPYSSSEAASSSSHAIYQLTDVGQCFTKSHYSSGGVCGSTYTGTYYIASQTQLVTISNTPVDTVNINQDSLPYANILNIGFVNLDSIYATCDTSLLLKVRDVPGYVRMYDIVSERNVQELVYNKRLNDSVIVADSLYLDSASQLKPIHSLANWLPWVKGFRLADSVGSIDGKPVYRFQFSTAVGWLLTPIKCGDGSTTINTTNTAYILQGTGLLYTSYKEMEMALYKVYTYRYYTADTILQRKFRSMLGSTPVGFPSDSTTN